MLSRISKKNLTTAALCLALCAFTTQSVGAQDAKRQFNKYRSFKTELINTIGSANKRVWISTDLLTDGDIVAALYGAKYRKLDVKVTLGQKQYRTYMSRYKNLKEQGIQVRLTPLNPSSTSALIDGKLVMTNSALDYRHPSFVSVIYGNSRQVRNYEKNFKLGIGNFKNYPTASRTPKGKMKFSKRSNIIKKKQFLGYTDKDGTYHYTQKKHPKPKNIPLKLPKKPKWQK